jgi:transposase
VQIVGRHVTKTTVRHNRVRLQKARECTNNSWRFEPWPILDPSLVHQMIPTGVTSARLHKLCHLMGLEV